MGELMGKIYGSIKRLEETENGFENTVAGMGKITLSKEESENGERNRRRWEQER